MSSSMVGELVTETFDYDGGRPVTVYVPPVPPEAVVFAGDGQLISQWGGVLEAAGVPPTMIVGTHRLDDEMLRLQEYSPVFDAERFAAHEKFFVDDVRDWARSRFAVALPAARTAVFGVSASAELALAMGLRHPDIYGAVFCASPGGGYRPPAVMPEFASARVPRRRRAGAVLSPERDPLGGRPARRRRGGCHNRAGRVARRRLLGRRVPADGCMGVCALNIGSKSLPGPQDVGVDCDRTTEERVVAGDGAGACGRSAKNECRSSESRAASRAASLMLLGEPLGPVSRTNDARCVGLRRAARHLAYSTARVSRMTVTLIWPG